MKYWFCVLLLITGCCPKPETPRIIILKDGNSPEFQVDASYIRGAKLCNEIGRIFRSVQEYDFTTIGQDYQIDIKCGDKKAAGLNP